MIVRIMVMRPPMIMMKMVREAAEARVHSMCFGYLDSGGDDEVVQRLHCDHYRVHYHYHRHYRQKGDWRLSLNL